ncbi:MAG: hypothetical protein AVO38_03745 [delta proteobacterium ML8_D]|nr:MAG: hypothetical protein AVO38_03745 [delta proteobacterium ML8_D]
MSISNFDLQVIITHIRNFFEDLAFLPVQIVHSFQPRTIPVKISLLKNMNYTSSGKRSDI